MKTFNLDDILKFEELCIKGESLLEDSFHYQNDCWLTMNCKKKRCPAYGKSDVRCWHVMGTLCCLGEQDKSWYNKWKSCQKCEVFKKATSSSEERLNEALLNIVLASRAMKNWSSSPVGSSIFESIMKQYKLTARQGEVLLLLLEKEDRKSIAAKLSVAENTIKMHVKSLYQKLQVSSKKELIHKIESLLGRA